MNLATDRKIQWCPGCGNFGIYNALKSVLEKEIEEGSIKKENIVLVSGIGCYGYITNYYHFNSFHTIHGRVPPLLTGIKLANPSLIPIGFVGDGDAFAEGMSHTIHIARRNSNTKLILHNNSVYGLTTGQFTPTSPKGFKSRSTPYGNPENPINPITLMLVSQATFVARGFSGDIKHLQYIFEEMMKHKGFAFVEVLQPCVTFNNTYQYYKERVYKLEDTDYKPNDFNVALQKSLEWGEKIPTGIFFKNELPTYEDLVLKGKNLFYERNIPDLKDIVNEFV
ncbi:MAG TPA: 2-oxoacid:ferredoxin oxidoreductase subunit beta [Thermodesulfobium narugense]|nr:2-oxoacid:ferredoxin oxidoreductase subunit beta [Thermodesulfobium narugense]